MSADGFELTWQDGLPVPPWDSIWKHVEFREPEARRDALRAAALQWLLELARALGGGYETVESRHFLALAPEARGIGRPLVSFAERCRATLRSVLGEVADFDKFGKPVVVVLESRGVYYRYISRHDPEGEYGLSIGIHIRDGFPHVVMHGPQLSGLENTLAHELTHVALHHLSMPLWLEEGLAQMFPHDMAPQYGLQGFQLDAETADRHKRYWREHGLDAFWSGMGFSSSDKAQRLSYELAEILVRLVVDDSRPRWFGWVREPQRMFFAFLGAASHSDCGDAACREHLGYGIGDLAARFLGPGSWSPSRLPGDSQ